MVARAERVDRAELTQVPRTRHSSYAAAQPTILSAMHVILVGAGLAGCLLATQLARAGHAVELYERRGDPRAKGFVGGRSINLAISERGLNALRTIGLDGAVLASGVRMPGRMIHPIDARSAGELYFQPYSADSNRAINSVSRGDLNRLLLDAAVEAGASVRFSHRCAGVDPLKATVEFVDESSGGSVTAMGDLVVACDGAYSVVRAALQKNEGFDYSQTYLGHGYKELTIPATASGGFAMERNALHIWPRGGFMMIALPNQDGSFTCTLFLSHLGTSIDEPGFDQLVDDASVGAFFNRWFGDAVPLMPALLEEFRRNPVGAMVTIRCRPWVRGRVALLGDAAHAVVPFYGQGANCAFEDCVALVECLKSSRNIDAALLEYQARRIDNANAIADLALRNFIEMRDHTASRLFHAKKKLEHALNRAFPNSYLPLYDMISFSTIPYAEARARAARQWKVVGAVAGATALVGAGAAVGLMAALIG